MTARPLERSPLQCSPLEHPPLEVRGLGHSYGGARVLDDVSLRFEAGQVHALIGRNGAGKTTLLRALSGGLVPTAGEFLVAGEPVRLSSPREAVRRGIATVHQELALVGELTIAENVLLDRLPRQRRLSWLLDHGAARRATARILGELGSSLDPRARVASLSFAEQQLVEIARAVGRAPRVLLLDEPTSALSPGEVDRLIALVRRLAAGGVAVVHVTHRLDELPRIADVVSVLRDGQLVGTIPAREAEPARLVALMFGDLVIAPRPGRRAALAAAGLAAAGPVLEAGNLAHPPRLNGVSLSVRPGEILGIAGLLGAGRSELLECLFGARPFAGDVLVAGSPVRVSGPQTMARRGVVLVPEHRKRQGLAMGLSIADNAVLPSLPRVTRRGFLTRQSIRDAIAPVLRRLGLIAPSLEHPVRALSGGNQQKVVVGKWLLEPRRVLLLDEPTKGIDLEARRQLFDGIRGLADDGMAVIMASSELEELHATCDRLVVLVRGRAVAEVDPATTSLATLLSLAMGGIG